MPCDEELYCEGIEWYESKLLLLIIVIKHYIFPLFTPY